MKPTDKRVFVNSVTVSFALSAAAGIACYLTAGATLVLPIGVVLFAAILAPPLCLLQCRTSEAAVGVAAIALGLALVFPFTTHGWLSCTLVVLSFVAALAAGARALVRLRFSPIVAAALVTSLALAWLTWPVWASPWLAGQSVRWSVSLHPLFAINAACHDLGIWTEQRIAYRLTNLGQDVPYQLPDSALPCVVFHGIICGVMTLITNAVLFLYSRRRQPAGS